MQQWLMDDIDRNELGNGRFRALQPGERGHRTDVDLDEHRMGLRQTQEDLLDFARQ